MNACILIVDDDRRLCEMLTEYLRAEAFAVVTVHDGQAALDELADGRDADYAAVVMDITMPVLDGFEALRQLRRFSTVPVIMLTARGEELDRIVGLEIGADDYLPKPFSPRELAARLRAILRRARAESDATDGQASRMLRAGDIELDTASRSMKCGGTSVATTSTEFAVLLALALARGEAVSKDELSRAALGRRWMPSDRSLDTHVSNLRRKLGPRSDGSPRIVTLRGRGYAFVAEEADS